MVNLRLVFGGVLQFNSVWQFFYKVASFAYVSHDVRERRCRLVYLVVSSVDTALKPV